MKKALKELIENAEIKRKGKFTELMFVSGTKYNGVFGPNGFNNMIVLGKNVDKDDTWYRIVSDKNQCDKFDIYSEDMRKANHSFNLDIPEAYGAIHIWFTDMYFDIDYSLQISSLIAKLEDR